MSFTRALLTPLTRRICRPSTFDLLAVSHRRPIAEVYMRALPIILLMALSVKDSLADEAYERRLQSDPVFAPSELNRLLIYERYDTTVAISTFAGKQCHIPEPTDLLKEAARKGDHATDFAVKRAIITAVLQKGATDPKGLQSVCRELRLQVQYVEAEVECMNAKTPHSGMTTCF
jgi:hypothetical protein